MFSRTKALLIVLATVAVIGAVWWLCQIPTSETPPPPSEVAEAPVDPPQAPTQQPLPKIPTAAYQEAARQFEIAYGREPDRLDTLSLLGEAALHGKNWSLAAASFQEIPTSHPQYGIASRYQQGEAFLQMGRVRDAESCYLAVVKQPDSAYTVSALYQLIYLYSVQLREEEEHDLLGRLVARKEADLSATLKYCFPSLHRWNGSLAVSNLEQMWENDPGDFRLRVALGRYRAGQGRLEEAREILESCRQDRPQDLSAQAALLECLYELGDWDAFGECFSRLPTIAEDPPWLLLRMQGKYYQQQQQYAQAEDCYRQLLERIPTDAPGNLGLAEVSAPLGKEEQRIQTLRKAQDLARIQNRLGWVGLAPEDPEPLVQIVEACRDAGLLPTARLVLDASLQVHPDHETLLKLGQEIEAPTAAPPQEDN